MARLSGKTVLVTGGNSGIGLATAKRFIQEGARVFITGRNPDSLNNALAELGEQAQGIQADVTQHEDVGLIVQALEQAATSLDSLVISAGISECASLADTTAEHFDKTFNVNARAPLLILKSVLPLMPQGASVVLVGSIAGFIGTPGYGTYGASKAALRAYARTWTNELADRGIRVNVVSPGPIDTPMMAAASDEIKRSLLGFIPLKRLGKPEEVAAAVLFLASDESSFVAGSELCIDGGMAQV
ncbi:MULTISPECIES: SDR family oxidoreductase [Pseudomonas]|uniref:SDR family oxidoreductase n=1 Tax=Pseudomonas quercus TaxID=2722792 RepID=A0ABX0YM42_9PSED|nr:MULTISPECIES: glucose 1-dehydrogenase [Pseudomonas]MBF7144680.1 SDR family oxidoreductase [Pseudomonas sp. LY10J]NJP03217.1 SDR family oxidoreductase [Pseudomonas quercus]